MLQVKRSELEKFELCGKSYVNLNLPTEKLVFKPSVRFAIGEIFSFAYANFT